MNIENKNIQVATGSPRTISVYLVDAAGVPVTSGVAVELMLTAPLTGAPRIIRAVPQAGTYTITVPADLSPVTNPATGEPIPWHYALRAGASAAVARGSFLSGELHLLPAVLAGDLTSPISLAATYDPASASVSSAAFASPTPGGVSVQDLVTHGVFDGWQEDKIKSSFVLGSLSGQGSALPTPYAIPVSGFTFKYKTLVPVTCNRLCLSLGAHGDPPLLIVNGVKATWLRVVTTKGELYELEYSLPEVRAEEWEFTITGATALGVGSISFDAELVTGTLNGGYPGVLLQNVTTLQCVGIKEEVYMVRVVKQERFVEFAATRDMDGILNYLITDGGMVVYDYGSLSPGSMGDACVGFTLICSADRRADVMYTLNELAGFYAGVNAGAELKIIRLR